MTKTGWIGGLELLAGEMDSRETADGRRNRVMIGALAVVFVVVSLAATLVGGFLQIEVIQTDWQWGWLGQVVAIPVVLAFLAVLQAGGILTFREAGFVARLNVGSAVPTLVATGLLILLVTLANYLAGGTLGLSGASTETVAFQATMPGLAEEPIYRGVLLGLLGLAFADRFRLFGVAFGWALILQAIVFGLLHGLGGPVALAYSVAVGLVLGWMRLKTGSLWPCILAHNIVNVYSFTFFTS